MITPDAKGERNSRGSEFRHQSSNPGVRSWGRCPWLRSRYGQGVLEVGVNRQVLCLKDSFVLRTARDGHAGKESQYMEDPTPRTRARDGRVEVEAMLGPVSSWISFFRCNNSIAFD